MHVYAARQAILNRNKQAVAYELLFRDGASNSFPGISAYTATSRLITNQHLNVGFNAITRGKRALINFSEQSLLDQVPLMLPASDIVIEILEDVRPTDAVYDACRAMFHQGYRFALDDFQYQDAWLRFMNFTRLIKFDIQKTPVSTLPAVIDKIKSNYKHVKFLAEKVETHEEFKAAKALGIEFYQGYFFCKPEIFSQNDIDVNCQIVLAVYAEVLKPTMSYQRLTHLFEKDVSLTYKLLKFINSGLFELVEPMSSIKQCLIYLGEDNTRRFVSLLATAHLSVSKPMELISVSITRARFCELIAAAYQQDMQEPAFLLGLFSLIDAILDKPMENLANSLPLTDEIRDALVGYSNSLSHILALVTAYESGSWYNTEKRARVLNIDQDALPSLYNKAVAWSDSFEGVVAVPLRHP